MKRRGILRARTRGRKVEWEEIRGAAAYPSWPKPIVTLKCRCGVEFTLPKSGRAELRHARSMMRRHVESIAHEQGMAHAARRSRARSQ